MKQDKTQKSGGRRGIRRAFRLLAGEGRREHE